MWLPLRTATRTLSMTSGFPKMTRPSCSSRRTTDSDRDSCFNIYIDTCRRASVLRRFWELETVLSSMGTLFRRVNVGGGERAAAVSAGDDQSWEQPPVPEASSQTTTPGGSKCRYETVTRARSRAVTALHRFIPSMLAAEHPVPCSVPAPVRVRRLGGRGRRDIALSRDRARENEPRSR